MANGYAGKILHVNLTSGILTDETPSEAFYRKYIGGSAMGLYYILQGTQPGVGGIDPENILTLMVSAPTGAPISGQSRISANARSPLVEGIGDAQAGGFFPAELKFAGYDGIVITGKAEQPVYLWIHDSQAELRPAGHLWGTTTTQALDLLKAELGDDKIEVAGIGPAGEAQSRLAAIINMGNRANGRTGMGAVMGSKNLKAVVVRGKSKKLALADSKKINEMARAGAQNIPNNLDIFGLRELGTASVVSPQHVMGTLPTHNYNEGQFAGFENLSGETMRDTILKENDTCYACSVRCKRVVETEWLHEAVEGKHGGPEYETIGTFGSYCGIDDLKAVSYANMICNEYGLDTIGAGATIAWVMECFQNGLLHEDEIGFPLPFGDAQGMTRMVKMMAERSGIGALLANGSQYAANQLGKGHEYLITVKGSEAPAHMPQAKRSLALIYAVNAFGADHQSHEHDPSIEEGASPLCMERMASLGFDHPLKPRSLDEEKVDFARKTQIFYSFLDSAGLCQFVWGPAWHLYGPDETVEIMRAVTGWADFSLAELMQVGERRLNLMRLFNAREGVNAQADSLPAKFFKPLQGDGPTAGVAITQQELDEAKRMYYRQSGWDEQTGLPVPEKRAELGLP